MAPPNQTQQSAKGNPEHENEIYFNYLIIGAVALIILGMMIRYLAIASIYLYSIVLLPVWSMGKYLATTGSVIMLMLYAVICGVIGGFLKFKSSKKALTWFALAGVFGLLTVIEFVTGFDYSIVTGYMNVYCNPTEGYVWTAIFHCNNTVEKLMAVPLLVIVGYAVLPNLIFATPLIADLAAGFFRLSSEHPKSLSTQVHDVDSLIKSQKVLYPHLKIYDKLNPNDLDIYGGQLRILDGSRRFVFDRELVTDFVERPMQSSDYGNKTGEVIKEENEAQDYNFGGDDLVPVIDVDKFKDIMMEQLGSMWTDSANLTPAETIILSIVLPRACCIDEAVNSKKAKEVDDDCYRRIAEVWNWVDKDISAKLAIKNKIKKGKKIKDTDEERLNQGLERFPYLEEYRETIDDWLNSVHGQVIVNSHAYNRTILFRALEDAKLLGVMQPSNFRWLKFYDRTIWALVQNVSRPSGFAENIATLSHYKTERRSGAAVYRPSYQAAYNGLMERIREFKYTPEQIEAWKTYLKYKDGGSEYIEQLNQAIAQLQKLNMVVREE